MRKDGIDIAVFVAGSFDANRLEAAARRCAPVQISLHDGATSGIEAIDALIADPWLVPRRESDRFTERVLRLPNLYLHQAITDAPDPALPDGPPVFAAAANPAKLNPRTLLNADVLYSSYSSDTRRYNAQANDTATRRVADYAIVSRAQILAGTVPRTTTNQTASVAPGFTDTFTEMLNANWVTQSALEIRRGNQHKFGAGLTAELAGARLG